MELLRNMFVIFSEKAKAELTKHTVFTEYLKEEDPEENTLQNDLFFDLSNFKANRKVRNTHDNLTVIDRETGLRWSEGVTLGNYIDRRLILRSVQT